MKFNFQQAYSDEEQIDLKAELLPLYATPIQITKYGGNLSKETKFIEKSTFNRANIGGNSQSQDTFILNNGELFKIKNFIELSIKNFKDQIYQVSDDIVITQSWGNKNSSGQAHHSHHHPNSIWSGVFFLKVSEDTPPISFKRGNLSAFSWNHTVPNQFNNDIFHLKPELGDLIIFPSTLEHWVEPNQSKNDRVTISFNTFAKGSLGSIETLTFLPLEDLK